jgi:hypothetical protein
VEAETLSAEGYDMNKTEQVAAILACNLSDEMKESMISQLFQTEAPAKVEPPKDGVLPAAKDVAEGTQMTGRKYPKKGSAHLWESRRRTSDGGAYWHFVS